MSQFKKHNLDSEDDDDDDDSMEGLDIPTGSAVNKGFRIHGTTAAAAQRAATTAAVVLQAMTTVEQRFRSNSCNVGGFISSALSADVRNFDKVHYSLRMYTIYVLENFLILFILWATLMFYNNNYTV